MGLSISKMKSDLSHTSPNVELKQVYQTKHGVPSLKFLSVDQNLSFFVAAADCKDLDLLKEM